MASSKVPQSKIEKMIEEDDWLKASRIARVVGSSGSSGSSSRETIVDESCSEFEKSLSKRGSCPIFEDTHSHPVGDRISMPLKYQIWPKCRARERKSPVSGLEKGECACDRTLGGSTEVGTRVCALLLPGEGQYCEASAVPGCTAVAIDPEGVWLRLRS